MSIRALKNQQESFKLNKAPTILNKKPKKSKRELGKKSDTVGDLDFNLTSNFMSINSSRLATGLKPQRSTKSRGKTLNSDSSVNSRKNRSSIS